MGWDNGGQLHRAHGLPSIRLWSLRVTSSEAYSVSWGVHIGTPNTSVDR